MILFYLLLTSIIFKIINNFCSLKENKLLISPENTQTHTCHTHIHAHTHTRAHTRTHKQ